MIRALLVGLMVLCVAGCAKFPSGGVIGDTKRLVFRMRVDGQLRTGQGAGQSGLPYVYIIALNVSTEDTPTTTGPIPIVVPGGNGMVDGTVTHFILWNPLASPQFQIYKFRDATLNEWFQTGIPVNYTPTNEGDREFTFEIDLSQLVAAVDVPNQQSVQVNFLTMNNTNTSGGGRIWDALGNANIPSQVNSPLTVRLNSSQIYNNQNQIITEPQGDTVDPDLDIVDWSVEVRIQ
ncbi:MAG: hypothetical protein KF836_03070 [Fimbriimonadaceae bacterium]|nr:hypothetical protein [Fimbriimonadaceae bacterium]